MDKHLWAFDGNARSSGQDERAEEECRDPRASAYNSLLEAYTDVLQTSKHTKELGALQKGADFVKAFALGFDVNVSRCLFSRDTFMIGVLTSKFRTLSLFLD